ncbi:Predicted PurR-regulated permease PerM [Sporanaerobacter acetigenes DSM 13106]|uniref:Predicted PurR-regulated permease PerM n=1 Tax=Sporanaerobacter acetigenes DSM 13106 TaxID=1123281 RepID=A0A1M5YAX8_9FIRM|nr:Predicted PurR-regulated permease PerM [Sporanaerobacter acetigenes DSM 13106]
MVNSDEFLATLNKILKPFIWAFVIAFFLNSLLVSIEKKHKSKRWVNILIVYLIFFGIIALFFIVITPTVVDSIKNLARDLPGYMRTTQRWLETLPSRFSGADKYGIVEEIQSALDNLILKASEGIGPLLNKTLTQIINFTSGFVNFVLGAIISIYILKDKEGFVKGFKKLNYALFSKERAESIITVQNEIKEAFSKFFVGKIIDSAIIGVLCFIGLIIMKVPYAVLISLIVGVINMIPYFGPFIGMIPAGVITLFDRPIKALWVIIFIFALQQFDGLYLGPKILGIQVGMKPFWIITAILVGGGFFGVWGMLFAVPVAAVVKTLFDRYTKRQFEIKGLNNK